MKISAIVPVYNPGSHIDECIRTLLAQSLPAVEYEVIFVDDGSTDGTAERLDALAAAHPNVRVRHIPNSGWPGRPRNVGLDMARGEFVYFVDNDDWVGEQALERLYDRARRDGADIVVGKVVGEGKNVPRDLFMADRTARIDWPPLLKLLPPHRLFRRELLVEHGIRFPEERAPLEDHLFVVHAFFHAGVISILATYPCYHWVRHEDGNAYFGPVDADVYYASLRRVLDLVVDHTEPGALRQQLLSHWYRSKMLAYVGGGWMVGHDAGRRRAAYDEVRRLAGERYEWDVERLLPFNLRLRSALLRAGGFAALERLAEWETALRAQVTLQELRPKGRGLVVRVEGRLRGAGGMVAFRRGDRRLLLMAPPEVAAAAAERDLDAGADMGDNDAELFLRSLDDGTEYAIHHDAQTRLVRARDGGVTPVQSMVAWISPGRGAAGAPLPTGDWEVLVRVWVAGFAATSRVRREDEDEPLVVTVDERGWLAERGTPVGVRQRVGRRHPGLARAFRRARASAGVG